MSNCAVYLKVPCATKLAKTMKELSTCASNTDLPGNVFPPSLSAKSSIVVPFSDTSFSGRNTTTEIVATNPSPSSSVTVLPAPSSIVHTFRSRDGSPSRSVSGSVSLDENMSTCESLKSPEFEYIDNEEISEKSIEKKTTKSLCISDYPGKEGFFFYTLYPPPCFSLVFVSVQYPPSFNMSNGTWYTS